MLIAAVSTVLSGLLLKWLIGKWLTEREACIATFSLVLGALAGSGLLNTHLGSDSVTSKAAFSAGLVVLWWVLFKRKRA